MTQEDAGGREIRIRLDSGGARDLGALHRWLSREEWFVRAERDYGLRVTYREEDGTERMAYPDGPPMGSLFAELVLWVVGTAVAPAFEDLYTRVKAAVRAWADNSGADMPRLEVGTPGLDDTDEGTDDGEGEGIR